MQQLKIDGKVTDLYAVSVPKEAYDYSLYFTNFTKKDIDNFWWISYRFLKTGIPFEDLANKGICTNIPSFEKIEILGEVTNGSVSFDVSSYIICLGEFDNNLWYMDYSKGEYDDSMGVDTKEKSFYSLLAANGIYFENPVIKPIQEYGHDIDKYYNEVKHWQYYESKLVDKIIIIKKVDPNHGND